MRRDFGLFQTEVKACDAAAAGHDLDETFHVFPRSLPQPALGLRVDDPGVRPGRTLTVDGARDKKLPE